MDVTRLDLETNSVTAWGAADVTGALKETNAIDAPPGTGAFQTINPASVSFYFISDPNAKYLQTFHADRTRFRDKFRIPQI